MQFLSTRGSERVSGAQAIAQGISVDGGLFVPETFPQLTEQDFEAMLGMDYAERAALIIHKFLDDYDYDGLLAACKTAYAKFDGGDAAPLVKVDDGMYMLELYHGPTCAFKDIALTLLPYLLRTGCDMCGIKEQILILVATSGDTGKAALEGFKDAKGIKVMVFYPDENVSKMQKLQMCTQEGDNVSVIAVRGNFDECQTAVKKIFTDNDKKAELKKQGIVLSSANSINFGRLVPQIAYYVSSYIDLITSEQIQMGDKVNFVVPTGNFGNILAAYYATKMGLPVKKLICASNKNRVLSDFFKKGVYDIAKRNFYRTMSPSMDILVSSNLERLLFELSGRDATLTAERMNELSQNKQYSILDDERNKIKRLFVGNWASEDECVETIYEFFMENGYALDPHTAVAMNVASKYIAKNETDTAPIIVVSTASAYKFPQDVYYALTGNDVKDSFKAIKRIYAETAMPVPDKLKALRDKKVRFTVVEDADKLYDRVLEFAKD